MHSKFAAYASSVRSTSGVLGTWATGTVSFLGHWKFVSSLFPLCFNLANMIENWCFNLRDFRFKIGLGTRKNSNCTTGTTTSCRHHNTQIVKKRCVTALKRCACTPFPKWKENLNGVRAYWAWGSSWTQYPCDYLLIFLVIRRRANTSRSGLRVHRRGFRRFIILCRLLAVVV